MPTIFGLTGSIATGKSTVSRILCENDIPTVDGDLIARQLVEPGKVCFKQLTCHFGSRIVLDDGSLNRKALGQIIFHDAAAKKELDHIMFPFIKREVNLQIRALCRQGYDIVGFDSALIIESGEADNFRPLIVVHCDPKIQVERLMKRNHFTRDEAVVRISCQLSSKQKLKYADLSIDTSGTIFETTNKIHSLIADLSKWN